MPFSSFAAAGNLVIVTRSDRGQAAGLGMFSRSKDKRGSWFVSPLHIARNEAKLSSQVPLKRREEPLRRPKGASQRICGVASSE